MDELAFGPLGQLGKSDTQHLEKFDHPVFSFRVVRKGITRKAADQLVTKLLAKHPHNDYRVVLLDGADSGVKNPEQATIYRVLMLRGASSIE